MATINQGISSAHLTISKQEAEWLVEQATNYSGGLNINLWQKGDLSRLYIQFSGKKEKAFFDLNAETLEAGMSVALANAIVAFIESQMPVVEEVVESNASPISHAVIDGEAIAAIETELEAETKQYHDHFEIVANQCGVPDESDIAALWNEATRTRTLGESLETTYYAWRDALVKPLADADTSDKYHIVWRKHAVALDVWNVFFNDLIPAIQSDLMDWRAVIISIKAGTPVYPREDGA